MQPLDCSSSLHQTHCPNVSVRFGLPTDARHRQAAIRQAVEDSAAPPILLGCTNHSCCTLHHCGHQQHLFQRPKQRRQPTALSAGTPCPTLPTHAGCCRFPANPVSAVAQREAERQLGTQKHGGSRGRRPLGVLPLLAGACSGQCSSIRAPGSAAAPHRPPAATRRRRHSLLAARRQAGAASPAAMAAHGTASTTAAAARAATASACPARSALSAGGVAGAGFCGGGVCCGRQRGAHQVLRHPGAPWLYRQGERGFGKPGKLPVDLAAHLATWLVARPTAALAPHFMRLPWPSALLQVCLKLLTTHPLTRCAM